MTFLVVLGLAAVTQAQTFTVLYNFGYGPEGGVPYAGVVQDPAGNLYGTTIGGDPSVAPYGAVYEVDTSGVVTALHTFSGAPDGSEPVAPVVLDMAGNIYGTTISGGSANSGVIFKIDTSGNETVLYSFSGGSDGRRPEQGLVIDAAGNLYGTTAKGGSSNKGTIFRVDSAGTFTLLHSFTGSRSDGAHPRFGHLAMDQSGNLYGVTRRGGGAPG